ncbi:MAG: hypothetical protein COB81_07615 [Flavobacteriaceae bacterium]|nr:MAG: hypothetical protein COB81_07615 [Flavobacteriaceae bacterium]
MSKLREISEEELKKILTDHQYWLSGIVDSKPADLSFCDLAYKNLRGAELNGANLIGANFIEADLEKVLFKNANLANANFYNANLSNANLENANFSKANFTETNLKGANLENANLEYSVLYYSNLTDANLNNTNLEGVDLSTTIIPLSSLLHAINVQSPFKQSSSPNEISYSAINEIKNILSNEELSSKQKEKYENQIKKLTKDIAHEKEAKEKTRKQITEAVKELEKPNKYIKSQLIIQYVLSGFYIVFIITIIIFLRFYIESQYLTFKHALSPSTTFISWLFYTSPIILSVSLIIVLINQINVRIKNVVLLNERKRYVDSVDGSLKAIHALSNSNEQAREKILDIMDKIIDNTLQNSEKSSKPFVLEEDTVKDPLQTLKDIKHLLK